MQFVIEVVVAVDAQVVADLATVGCDGLVMWDAVEAEELPKTAEVVVGDADGLLVSQPFFHITMIGLAALGSTFSGNEDQLHVVALGNLCTEVFTALNGRFTRSAAHTPEVDDEVTARIFGTQ